MSKRKREETLSKREKGTPKVSNPGFEDLRDENGKIGWVETPGEILLAWKGKPWNSRPKKLALLVACYIAFYLIALKLFPDMGLFLVLIPLLLLGSASAHLLNSF